MTVTILEGDVLAMLAKLPDESIHCCVTSPPYWGLRDYGVEGQIGLELTLAEHLDVMVRVCAEVHRVLRKDGTFWINYGDCYATSPNGRSAADTKAVGNDDRTFRDKPFSTIQGTLKPKDLCMIPNRLAIALQDWGWWVRSEIIWHKPNPMPESVTDRPAGSHEKIFLLSRSPKYFYDADAVREPPTDSTNQRLSQDVENQKGSTRAHAGGKTNGNMKAVSKKGTFKRENSKRSVAHHGQSMGTHRDDREDIDYCTGSRNLRNIWTVATKPFSEAHFATFPPDLIVPCIKAGTSEAGVCPECGAPWKRQTEKGLAPTSKAAKTFVVDERDENADKNDQGANRQKYGHKLGYISTVKTLGFEQQCKCVTRDPIPATVLDLFGGAGTTGLVADRLGRDAILIELNPEYSEIARKRIGDDAGMFSPINQTDKFEES